MHKLIALATLLLLLFYIVSTKFFERIGSAQNNFTQNFLHENFPDEKSELRYVRKTCSEPHSSVRITVTVDALNSGVTAYTHASNTHTHTHTHTPN